MCQSLTQISFDNVDDILLKNSYHHTHMDPCPHILNPHDPAVRLWIERITDQNTLTGDRVHKEGSYWLFTMELGCTYLHIHIDHHTARLLQGTATKMYCKPQGDSGYMLWIPYTQGPTYSVHLRGSFDGSAMFVIWRVSTTKGTLSRDNQHYNQSDIRSVLRLFIRCRW